MTLSFMMAFLYQCAIEFETRVTHYNIRYNASHATVVEAFTPGDIVSVGILRISPARQQIIAYICATSLAQPECHPLLC